MTQSEMSERTTRALRVAGWSVAVALLALPAIAMQFTQEVQWTAGDFVFAGVMFGIVLTLFELAVRASTKTAYRVAVFLAVACAFLQVWINLAVGIIGNEDDPANWTYFAVVICAIVAAAVARGDAALLARAMIVVMVVQITFSAIHLIDGHFTLLIDVFFSALWLLAARLFAAVGSASPRPSD